MTRTVMTSLWQRAELLIEDDGWSTVADSRYYERLDDDRVRARFGRGAFDRVATGSVDAARFAELAPLIAESVSDELVQAGWEVSESGRLAFHARRGADGIDVRAEQGTPIQVRTVRCGRTSTDTFERVDDAEKRVLAAASEGPGSPA